VSELLQLYNHLSLIVFAASLLAILGLRVTTGSTTHQAALIRDFRMLAERASRNCLGARSAALALEFEAYENVVRLYGPKSTGRNFVEETDSLIRTLAGITKDCGNMRVAHLRRGLKALKQIEDESSRLLFDLKQQ
jgi:hypothetical protein